MESEPTSFALYGPSQRTRRPWSAALISSAVVYAAVGVALVFLKTTPRETIAEKRADLVFVERIALPEAGPPPPVLPIPAAPQAAPAAAPVVQPRQKVRVLSKPPPIKELVAPKEMPKEVPKEAEPEADPGVAVFGETGPGDPSGLEGGMQAGVVGGKVGVIDLPADATAPRPLASNQPPRYPESARRRGKSGTLRLRIVIQADGTVGAITILEGEEPFVTAARDAVSRWRFEPARHLGQAISVYRDIPIAFSLED